MVEKKSATDNAGAASQANGTDNAATPSETGGALARTGAEVVPAALAAVTVVAGMALLMAMRRRRA